MSDQAMAWARSIKTGSVGRKAVLYVLANHAGLDGTVHDCSQKAIAEEAELSERQVRTNLADLVTAGIIERERRGGTGKGRQHDIIRLRMAELPLILGAKRNRQPEAAAAKRATGSLQPRQQAATASESRSPMALGAHDPEVTAGSGGQPATGKRKSSPVASGIVLLEVSNNSREDNPPKPPRQRSERGARLADDWRLPRPWGVETRAAFEYTDHEIRFIAWQFANHWHSATGANARKRDWRRTWDNWVARQNRRSVVEGAKGWNPTTGEGAPVQDDGNGRTRAACIFRSKHGEWPRDFDPATIPSSVRAQFPKLFAEELSLSA